MLKSSIKNTLVLTYWTYKSGLIQSYTLPYVRMMAGHLDSGCRIVLVTLEQPNMALERAEAAAEREALARDRIDWISFPYNRFGLVACLQAALSLAVLFRLCLRQRVSMIHCFCTPAGALGYLLSVLTGIPLVIDSYEPHAEAMIENGTWAASSLRFRLLFLLERLQSHRASVMIATTEGMRGYAQAKYGVTPARFFVKPACVDLARFRTEGLRNDALAADLGFKGNVVCVYAGKLGGIYLEREVFDFFKVANEHWRGRFRALLLTDADPERLGRLCDESGFDRGALRHLFAPHREVPGYLALADFALTPVRPVPTKRLCAPIKDGEYWAMGLPIVITKGIAEDSRIIAEERIGAVLAGFTPVDYLRAVREIDALLAPELREEIRRKIRDVAVGRRGFDQAERVYRAVYG